MSTGNQQGGRSGPPRWRNPSARHPDSYRHDAKAADSIVCDDCNVVQHGGRWYWGAPPLGEVRGGLCPACQRTRDRQPAGTIRLTGALAADRAEVERLVRSVEEAEKATHPLERVIAVEAVAAALVITTTGIHIARRITTQLERRFHRKAELHYDETHELRVEWNG